MTQDGKIENQVNEQEQNDSMNPRLEENLHIIARYEGFTDYKIYAKNITPDGNNFLGELCDVSIKQDTKDGSKELNLFVKSVLTGEEIAKVIKMDQLYDNEIFVYIELSKIYSDLQDQAKIPIEERYKFIKCYKESNTEFLIMENVAKEDYKPWCRFDVMSLEYAEKCINALAKFHALSFIVQKQQPEYFNKRLKVLKFPIGLNDQWSKYMTSMCEKTLEYLNENSREKFKKFMPRVTETFRKYYLHSEHFIKCLCHGDFKANNILWRTNNGNIEIIPIDYQLLHYGSPITDLMFFIFTATDKEFRRNYMEDLKTLYFNTMEEFMKNFDLHIEDIFPRKYFEKVFRETLDYGLVISIWLLPALLADLDKVNDVGETSIEDLDFGTNERTKVRVQEIVDDFIEWGFL